MSDEYEITCARCFVTLTGKDRTAVDTAFRGHEKEAHGFMTGQEFYDRLVKEWLALPKDHGYTDMLDAAKKAAGLE